VPVLLHSIPTNSVVQAILFLRYILTVSRVKITRQHDINGSNGFNIRLILTIDGNQILFLRLQHKTDPEMGFTKHKHDSLNNNTNSTLSCKSCSRLIRRVRCSRQLSIFTSLLFVLIFIIYNMSHSSPMLQTLTKSTLNRTYENNLPETDTISIFTESLKETIEAALTPLTKVDHLDVSTGLGLFPMSLRNFSNVVDSYR